MITSARISAFLGIAATSIAMLAAVALLITSVTMPPVAWTILLFALLASLGWIDALTETVPDVLTLALVVCGVVYAATAGLPLVPHIAGSGLLLSIGVIHGYLTGDEGWVGSGDFFLVAGINAWFGPALVVDVLALTSVGLVLHGIIARRAAIALAPSLACAAAIIWLGGPLL